MPAPPFDLSDQFMHQLMAHAGTPVIWIDIECIEYCNTPETAKFAV